MKIGLFDSGLGGLTILRAVTKALPEHDYFYYGDTAHLPYGDRSEDEIYELSKVAMGYLFSQGCTLVIIACNTASAETLRKLQDDHLPTAYPDRRILGVIIPTIETIIDGGSKEVLLLATKRTVSSQKYERELGKRGSTITLHAHATPELVPLIEAGELSAAEKKAITIIDSVLAVQPTVDTVILGCTHYTELKDALRTKYGERLRIISQDEVIPAKLAQYISRHTELQHDDLATGKRSIHLTAHRSDYDRITAQLLGGAYIAE